MTDETSTTPPAFDYAAVKNLTGGELATVVLDLIEDNRDRWNQSSWRQDNGPVDEQVCSKPVTSIEAFAEDPLNPACTTSFCYAGWVGAVKGVKWAKGNTEVIGDPARGCNCTGFCCVIPAHQVHISLYARIQLGISEYEADLLFKGENSIYTLRDYVEQIVETGEINHSSDDGEYSDDDDDDDF